MMSDREEVKVFWRNNSDEAALLERTRETEGCLVATFEGIKVSRARAICTVGNDPTDVRAEHYLTTKPDDTLDLAISFFRERHSLKLSL